MEPTKHSHALMALMKVGNAAQHTQHSMSPKDTAKVKNRTVGLFRIFINGGTESEPLVAHPSIGGVVDASAA